MPLRVATQPEGATRRVTRRRTRRAPPRTLRVDGHVARERATAAGRGRGWGAGRAGAADALGDRGKRDWKRENRHGGAATKALPGTGQRPDNGGEDTREANDGKAAREPARSGRADTGSAHERRRGERRRGAMRPQVTAMKRVPRRNPPGERQTNEQAKREGTTSSREGQHQPRRRNPADHTCPENLSPRKEPSTVARAARLPRQRSARESARRPRTRPNRERPARPAPTGSPRA